MKRCRRSALALLLLLGLLAAPQAVAGTRFPADGPRCRTDVSPGNHEHRFPRLVGFIVTTPDLRGALGVWEHRSGFRVHVRVEPGEDKASKWLDGRFFDRGYDLVRCEITR